MIVMAWNLQAAVVFLAAPHRYLQAFQLSGVPGQIAIQGVGVLFLMWQVPYAFALVSPSRHRVSMIEALIMQILGVVGESLLILFLPSDYPRIRDSLKQFVLFDGIGVILLFTAWMLAARGKLTENRIQED